MIREVHVYGRVEKLQHAGINNAQHRGLGTQLVNRACELASRADTNASTLSAPWGRVGITENSVSMTMGCTSNACCSQCRSIACEKVNHSAAIPAESRSPPAEAK